MLSKLNLLIVKQTKLVFETFKCLKENGNRNDNSAIPDLTVDI